jgi:glucose/arabinose dehydrogenase
VVVLGALAASAALGPEPEIGGAEPATELVLADGEIAGPPEPEPAAGAPGPALDEVDVTLTQVAQVNQSIALAANAANGHLYVGEREGRIRLIRREVGPDGSVTPVLEPEPLLEFTDEVSIEGERGLLGVALEPDGRALYLSFTALDGDVVIDGYRMDGDRPDPGSRRELLRIPHPAISHNGGDLEVGTDGYLWFGMGDGGAPEHGGQGEDAADLDLLFGKMLRIDPQMEGDEPYLIPEDNPYAGGGGRPEIWASGLRNPWRFSFDRQTDDLWIADVGEHVQEEVDVLPADEGWLPGADLGWPAVEGTAATGAGEVPADAVAPVFTYGRGDGPCAIIGGIVYRGENIPALQGVYVYTDLCDQEIRGLVVEDGEVVGDQPLGVEAPAADVVSVGEGPDGELYLVSLFGKIFRVDPA